MVAHDVRVRGLRLTGADTSVTLLKRIDQEFLDAVLQELGTPELRHRLIDSVMANGTAPLRLFQPVHRTFHIALFEVTCQTLGTPRVDPTKIESAGLIVRRRRESGSGSPQLQGWMQADQAVLGWTPLSSPEQTRDPDPARRPPELELGNPELNRALALRRPRAAEVAEVTSPLFVAPPDVCAAAKRTLLYGVVPVTSSDRADGVASIPSLGEGLTADRVLDTLPRFLRGPTSGARRKDIEQFLIGIGAAIEPERAEIVLSVLDELQALPGDPPVGTVLRNGAARLSSRKPSGLPAFLGWQRVQDTNFPMKVAEAVRQVIELTTADVAPALGRFDDLRATYQLRAFARVKRDDGCPPSLVWSEPSAPYTIVPWYESGDAPPTRVTLPDVTDLATLKKLKPNIAFVSPGKIFEPLNGVSLDDLMGGKQSDSDLGLDWICGFSIPILTLCALIVLSVFLGLLNFIFWWLPFVKICVPVPRPRGNSP